ncbi:MAG: four helix bundle protein [Chitinophagales bacterium]
MKDFTELGFWKDAHSLANEIYDTTYKFPKSEMFGLTSQLRRASLSVPTNIVEGCGRESVKELRRFLIIASGSISEVQYLLFFSHGRKFITKEEYEILNAKSISIKKRLTIYKNKL